MKLPNGLRSDVKEKAPKGGKGKKKKILAMERMEILFESMPTKLADGMDQSCMHAWDHVVRLRGSHDPHTV